MALDTSGYETALNDLDDELLTAAQSGNPKPVGFYREQLAIIEETYIKTGSVSTSVSTTTATPTLTGPGAIPTPGTGAGSGTGSIT